MAAHTAKSRPAHKAKQAEVERLADRFKKAEVAILAEFRGLTVDKVTQLRADLRKGKSELKVVKNTLAKRAVTGTRYESLKDKLKGPVAIALSFGDVVFPAKTLDKFLREEKGLTILGGSLGGKLLTPAEIKELASLPDLNTSRAMLLGMLLQPAAGLARLLEAYRKKQEGAQGGAPAPAGGPGAPPGASPEGGPPAPST